MSGYIFSRCLQRWPAICQRCYIHLELRMIRAGCRPAPGSTAEASRRTAPFIARYERNPSRAKSAVSFYGNWDKSAPTGFSGSNYETALPTHSATTRSHQGPHGRDHANSTRRRIREDPIIECRKNNLRVSCTVWQIEVTGKSLALLKRTLHD